jgi:hypothetical protein
LNFNTIGGSGNVSVTTYVSPSMNAIGNDRPLKIAVQVDGGAPQTTQFMPLAANGATPAGWDGNDGFAANSIVSVNNTFTGVTPGAHTLKVRRIARDGWCLWPLLTVWIGVDDRAHSHSTKAGDQHWQCAA